MRASLCMRRVRLWCCVRRRRGAADLGEECVDVHRGSSACGATARAIVPQGGATRHRCRWGRCPRLRRRRVCGSGRWAAGAAGGLRHLPQHVRKQRVHKTCFPLWGGGSSRRPASSCRSRGGSGVRSLCSAAPPRPRNVRIDQRRRRWCGNARCVKRSGRGAPAARQGPPSRADAASRQLRRAPAPTAPGRRLAPGLGASAIKTVFQRREKPGGQPPR